MKYDMQFIPIREIANGYKDSQENGVIGYNGQLNIRPAYQREFIYKDKQRNAVIETINKGAPFGLIYWAKNEDGTFEVIDGQQRTISFCQYINGEFSINDMYFHNLTEDKQNAILDYKVMVCVCDGTDSEKLDWFKTINIAGEPLNDQELLNAVYTGAWLSDAKEKFSKTNCVAQKIGNLYVNGTPIRQDYLATALNWISDGNVADYMAKHQHGKNANELWLYFQNVIAWVECVFETSSNGTKTKLYRKEMKGLNWGKLYNKYHGNQYDADEIEKRVHELMANEEVTEKKGVYEYILSGEDENLACKLSKRTFSENDKRTAYENQGHKCAITGEELPIEEMEADHKTPWWKGGTTTRDNLQMISKTANKRKGGTI
jgi:hypothetical protein